LRELALDPLALRPAVPRPLELGSAARLPAAARFEAFVDLAVDLLDDFAEERPRLAAPEFRPLVPGISTSSCSTPTTSEHHALLH
jgi:hypothetical protein